MIFRKKLELNKIYYYENMLDMSNEYYVHNEIIIFSPFHFEHDGYDMFVYKSYEKFDEDNPIVMFDYKTSINLKESKCFPIEQIKKSVIMDFIFGKYPN